MTKIKYSLTTPDGQHTVTRQATCEYDYAAFRVIELEDGTVTTDAPGTHLCASFGNAYIKLISKVQINQPYKVLSGAMKAHAKIKRVISLHVIPTQYGAAKNLTAWHKVL